MDCRQCTDDLSAYLDREVSPARVKLIESHLSACRDCAEEYRALQASARLIESHARELQPRQESWNLLRARLNTMETPDSGTGFLQLFLRFRLMAAAAAIAIATFGMGLWGYLRYQQSERELQQYMNAYIETREQEEHRYRRQMANLIPKGASATITPVIHAERSSNPFASYEPTSFENPFQSEGQ
jgi:anti-sigma factor RsiW